MYKHVRRVLSARLPVLQVLFGTSPIKHGRRKVLHSAGAAVAQGAHFARYLPRRLCQPWEQGSEP